MLLLDVKCSPVNVNYARNREGRTTVKNTDEVSTESELEVKNVKSLLVYLVLLLLFWSMQ